MKEVKAGHWNARGKIAQILENNKNYAIKQKQDFQEMIEKKRLEKQAEKKKRDELISQIRDAERQPIKRTKGYDPTETSSLNFI